MMSAFDDGRSAIIYAKKREVDLKIDKAELLVRIENLKQRTKDAEAQLTAGIAEGSISDSDKAELSDHLEELKKQSEAADDELCSLLDEMVAQGIGASEELHDGVPPVEEDTEGNLKKRLKEFQAHRAAGNLTSEQSEEMRDVLKQLAEIAKNCDPKEAVKTQRFTSLLTGQTVTIKGRSLEFSGEVLTDVRPVA
jgi:seryl-tRNA synthetase